MGSFSFRSVDVGPIGVELISIDFIVGCYVGLLASLILALLRLVYFPVSLLGWSLYL